MERTTIREKKRLIIAFLIFSLFLLGLLARTGYIQVVQGPKYQKKAAAQHTKDELVEARRGDIVDRNGEKLAVSTITYAVWIHPQMMEDKGEQVAEELAEILNKDPKEIEKAIDQEVNLVKVDKYLDRSTADEIRDWVSEEEISGVSLTEENKRFYPLGNFASQVMGSVTDDNNGLSGLEMYYNKELKGMPGRWIQNRDVNGKTLIYGSQQYFEPVDGSTLQLTLDVAIQNYAEQSIAETLKDKKADRVSCIVMEVKTGEILAMASNPGFDPNTPRVPVDPKEKKAYEQLEPSQQLEYLNKMWRNPLVSDTYVPGSTIKLLTASMALEEDLTTVNESFYANGSIDVAGVNLKCWRHEKPHGQETMKEAVGNSCNPVFIQLAQRIGMEKFYDYMGLFGFNDVTGIDFPGEGKAQMQDQKTAGPVGLATMGYGQGMAVTPIELITAIGSIANEGKLMKPHLLKNVLDSDGKVIEEIKPQQIRQTLSAATAKEMRNVMEYVVTGGGVSIAQIDGYRVGGKTGTSNIEADDNKIIASFVGVAPMDDPELIILYIVENPKTTIYGSTAAAPGGRDVLEQSLKYLNVPKEKETEKQSKEQVTVPDITGLTYEEAKEKVEKAQLVVKISPDTDEVEFNVIDQYPKAGKKVNKGETVYLYH